MCTLGRYSEVISRGSLVRFSTDVLEHLQPAALNSLENIKVDKLIATHFHLLVSILRDGGVLLQHGTVGDVVAVDVVVGVQKLASVAIGAEPELVIMELLASL